MDYKTIFMVLILIMLAVIVFSALILNIEALKDTIEDKNKQLEDKNKQPEDNEGILIAKIDYLDTGETARIPIKFDKDGNCVPGNVTIIPAGKEGNHDEQ